LLEASPNLKRWLQILGWACYLACSWTWCIGMFLPVLLVRDYGVWGFVVFAVPNVVGAAAMGWVLRKPGAAQALRQRHEFACRLFSRITIAFQCFFLAWSSLVLLGEQGFVALGMSVALLVALVAGQHNIRAILAIACAVYVVSLAGIFAFGFEQLGPPHWTPPTSSLAFLTTVCVFGFTLCPYLDMTFHRARAAVPGRNGTIAFALGFGVLFSAMILYTLRYSELAVDNSWLPEKHTPVFDRFLLLALHVILQLIFTIAVHLIERQRIHDSPPVHRRAKAAVFVMFLWGPFVLGFVGSFLPTFHGLSFNEFIYRLFLSFYGLIFPAYVWLCMIPTWRDPRKPTKRHIAVWLGACALAAPCYWMGFIERVEWWLVPGLAVVLLARLLIPPVSRGSLPPPAEPSPSLVPVHSGPPELSAAATPER